MRRDSNPNLNSVVVLVGGECLCPGIVRHRSFRSGQGTNGASLTSKAIIQLEKARDNVKRETPKLKAKSWHVLFQLHQCQGKFLKFCQSLSFTRYMRGNVKKNSV